MLSRCCICESAYHHCRLVCGYHVFDDKRGSQQPSLKSEDWLDEILEKNQLTQDIICQCVTVYVRSDFKAEKLLCLKPYEIQLIFQLLDDLVNTPPDYMQKVSSVYGVYLIC